MGSQRWVGTTHSGRKSNTKYYCTVLDDGEGILGRGGGGVPWHSLLGSEASSQWHVVGVACFEACMALIVHVHVIKLCSINIIIKLYDNIDCTNKEWHLEGSNSYHIHVWKPCNACTTFSWTAKMIIIVLTNGTVTLSRQKGSQETDMLVKIIHIRSLSYYGN